jgi:tetratricopeptide (TPR) repeat protein
LRAALEDSIEGRGGCFLISGEPGIGKTRLADELATDAASRGVRVAWGRCWEGGGAPAYWPWVEIVRALVLEPGRARQQQTPVPSEIGQLIPELAAETTQRPLSSDPEQGRFRLFDAVATVLKQVARSTPVVLILDDLHEADRGSLELLKFVARGLADSRVVIVGTYRDAEVRRSSSLLDSIGEIVRHGHPMPLAGLAETEVAQMIEHRAERSPSASFASELHRVTAGNPLFVDGVIRVLVAERKLEMAEHLDLSGFKLPEGVRGAIRKRLALLSAQARSALAVAAVIGPEFDLVLLERVKQEGARTLAELMHEAAEVSIVAAPSRHTYRFTHPLIREALYKDSTDAERTRLHRVIAEGLEETHAANLTPYLAAIANHFREAGIVEKAIDYSIRAGEAAYAVLAFEDAASHWQAALALMDATVADAERRAGLLERLGDPMLLGLEAKGLEYLEEALRLYKSLGRTRDAARVHLGIGNSLMAMKNQVLRDIPRASAHFREAEAALVPDPDDSLLGRLHVGLANVAGELLDREQRLKSSRQAMEIGERLGNELLWVDAAMQHAEELTNGGQVARGAELFARAWERADRLNDARACSAVTASAGLFEANRRDPVGARMWLLRELQKDRVAKAPSARQQLSHILGHTLVVAGKPTEAKALVGQAECLWQEASVSYWCGDWEQAEKILIRALEQQARKAGRPWQEFFSSLWLAKLRRASGRYRDAEGLLERAIDIMGKGRAVVFEIDARQELSSLLGEIGAPKQAHQHLARCGELMTPGEDWRGLAGAVARAEAIVAAAEGRLDDAESQFAHAVKIFQRYEVCFDEAEALDYWGRALTAAGQNDRAVEKLDAAIELYRHNGAGERWFDRILVEKARIELPAKTAPLLDLRASDDECLFRREGEYWTVAYGGATCRLKDMKGMGYIAHLIARPGQRIHVLDLFAQLGGNGAATVATADWQAENLEAVSDPGDASEVLDSRARAEYRRRISELQAELEEAESNNDPGRAERTRDELDSLTDGLRSALGLGGRSRRFTAETERTRGTVSKSIRTSLERIRRSHPKLGDHLGTCIRTGYFCAYLPDPGCRPPWRI